MPTPQHRYLFRIKYRRPEEPIEVASIVVYASSESQAEVEALNYGRRRIEAELVGTMGPEADERMQDDVIR